MEDSVQLCPKDIFLSSATFRKELWERRGSRTAKEIKVEGLKIESLNSMSLKGS